MKSTIDQARLNDIIVRGPMMKVEIRLRLMLMMMMINDQGHRIEILSFSLDRMTRMYGMNMAFQVMSSGERSRT